MPYEVNPETLSDQTVFMISGAVSALTAFVIPAYMSYNARTACQETFHTDYEWLNYVTDTVGAVGCEHAGGQMYQLTYLNLAGAYAFGGTAGVVLKRTVVNGFCGIVNRLSFFGGSSDKTEDEQESAELTVQSPK